MTADPAGWPDPARPGVPLNPERAWPHWVSYLDPDMPAEIVEWNGYAWGNREIPPEQMAGAWYYHGPVLTPADLAAERAAAAEAMREACAKWHDERGLRAMPGTGGAVRHEWLGQCIRALPIPDASALAEREKEAYRRGWLDRESDFMAGVERTGMAVTDESALAERDERMREEGA